MLISPAQKNAHHIYKQITSKSCVLGELMARFLQNLPAYHHSLLVSTVDNPICEKLYIWKDSEATPTCVLSQVYCSVNCESRPQALW